MSDTEMDKVTAGAGYGIATAGYPAGYYHLPSPPSGVSPGFGNSTAPGLQ
jgi:hypothetical protein